MRPSSPAKRGARVSRVAYVKGGTVIVLNSSFIFRIRGDEDANSDADRRCAIIEKARDIAVSSIRSLAGKTLSNIRVAQNNSRPIYRLPPEILSLVFKHALPFPNAKYPVVDTGTLLSVSWVSRLWREISINTPTLWTHIDAVNADLIHVFISRSRAAPLDVRLLPPDRWLMRKTNTSSIIAQRHSILIQHDNSIQFIGHLKPQMHRLRSLRLNGLSQGLLDRLLDTPAPLLTLFHVEPLKFHQGSSAPIANEATSPHFFRGETPLLREVRIVGITQTLTSPIFTGLVSLHLENISFTHSTNLHIFQLLIACPLLEDLALLRLTFLLMVDMSTTSLLSTPIHLPCLQRLELRAMQLELVRDMLASIEVSDCQYVNVHMEGPVTFTDFLPSDAKQLENLFKFSDIDEVELDIIHVPEDDQDPSCFIALSYPRHYLAIHHPNEDNDAENIVDGILSSVEQWILIPDLLSLSVVIEGGGVIPTIAAFIRMLRHLHAIESLTLTSTPTCYVETLTVTPERHLCPQLEDLCLYDCDISGESLIELVKSRIASNTGVDSVGDYHDELPVSSLRSISISDYSPAGDHATRKALQDLSIAVS